MPDYSPARRSLALSSLPDRGAPPTEVVLDRRTVLDLAALDTPALRSLPDAWRGALEALDLRAWSAVWRRAAAGCRSFGLYHRSDLADELYLDALAARAAAFVQRNPALPARVRFVVHDPALVVLARVADALAPFPDAARLVAALRGAPEPLYDSSDYDDVHG